MGMTQKLWKTGGLTSPLYPMVSRVHEYVVVAGDDLVGDFVDLAKRLLRRLDVGGIGRDLPREKMILRRHRIAGDQHCVGRRRDQQTAVALRHTEQWEEIHILREPVIRRRQFLQQ